MANPHYYVPAGLPPGQGPMTAPEGPPEGVYYYRLYAGLMTILSALTVAAGVGMFLVPLFSSAPPGSPGSAAEPAQMIAGVVYAGLGLAMLIPFLLSLFGGRHSWVHTLGTIMTAISMMSLCCVPLAIPVLIMWLKPETKRWYGAP